MNLAVLKQWNQKMWKVTGVWVKYGIALKWNCSNK